MTPQEVLDQYRTVAVVNRERDALALSLQLKKLSPGEQYKHFGGHHHYGFVYHFRHHTVPGVVMECVVSPMGDAITSVYADHPALATLGTLVTAREKVVKALAEKIGLSREAIGIEDQARGRSLGLEELSFGQLIDLLAEREGKTIAVSGSIGAEAPGVPS